MKNLVFCFARSIIGFYIQEDELNFSSPLLLPESELYILHTNGKRGEMNKAAKKKKKGMLASTIL